MPVCVPMPVPDNHAPNIQADSKPGQARNVVTKSELASKAWPPPGAPGIPSSLWRIID